MQIWQAALIGLFAYLGRNQVPWLFGTTGGFYMLGRPLVAGFICGLILGDVKAGILCAIPVQAMFIGQIVPGGALPSDLNLAAYIGIPLALVAGGDANLAVALAIPLGALGVGLHNFTMTFNAFWAHRADAAAAKGDAKAVRINNYCGTIVHFIERFFLVTLTCYLGAGFASQVMESIPPFVLTFLTVAGRMLPAVGFAILLHQIGAKRWMLSVFVMGWILMSTTMFTMSALVLIGMALALLYVFASTSNAFRSGTVAEPTHQAQTNVGAIEMEGIYED